MNNTPAYGVGHLRNVNVGSDIVEYLEKIDGTLAPYGGRFLIHGAKPEVREGDWLGDLIVIEFPDRASAVEWYESPGYQAIIPLRADNSDGTVFLVDGVDQPHKGIDALA